MQADIVDRRYGRQVFLLVPRSTDLAACQEGAGLDRPAISERLHRPQKFDVCIRSQHLEGCIRPDLIEPAFPHESALLLGVDQGQDVDIAAELVLGVEADHIGIDEPAPLLPAQRDSVVAIDDEVRAAYLVHADGREVPVGVLASKRPQAGGKSGRAWSKVAIEIDGAIERPDDPIHRDRLSPGVRLAYQSQASLHLTEWQQMTGR
jgi:hypothetical protein